MPSAAWEAMKVVLDARAEGRDEDAERLLAQPELEDIGWWCAKTNDNRSKRFVERVYAVARSTWTGPRKRWRAIRAQRRESALALRLVDSWKVWLDIPYVVTHVDGETSKLTTRPNIYREFDARWPHSIWGGTRDGARRGVIFTGQSNAAGMLMTATIGGTTMTVVADPSVPRDTAYVVDRRGFYERIQFGSEEG